MKGKHVVNLASECFLPISTVNASRVIKLARESFRNKSKSAVVQRWSQKCMKEYMILCILRGGQYLCTYSEGYTQCTFTDQGAPSQSDTMAPLCTDGSQRSDSHSASSLIVIWGKGVFGSPYKALISISP